MSLPLTFGLMMTAAVLLGLYASWQSLRAAFRAGHIRDLPSIDASEARRTLQDEKEAVLGNIRDLRFEHEAGKIAEDDFERQDTHLRARAREVLRLLDEDLDEYVRRAEKAILESLGPDARSPYRASADADSDEASPAKSKPAAEGSSCPSCDVSNDVDAEFCKKCGTRMAAVSCSSCSTENDADAEFCKKCGTKLDAAAKADPAADVPNAEAKADADAEEADETVDEAAADNQSADEAAADDEDDAEDSADTADDAESADEAATDDADDDEERS